MNFFYGFNGRNILILMENGRHFDFSVGVHSYYYLVYPKVPSCKKLCFNHQTQDYFTYQPDYFRQKHIYSIMSKSIIIESYFCLNLSFEIFCFATGKMADPIRPRGAYRKSKYKKSIVQEVLWYRTSL